MEPNISKIQQRAVQYWFIDGLAEIGLSAAFLLLAVLFVIQRLLPQSPLRDLASLLLAFAGVFGLRSIILRIKEKDTYLRTGYVAVQSGWKNKRIVAAVIVFTVALLGVQLTLVLRQSASPAWMPLIGGSILAFLLALMGYRAGLTRYYFLALFSLLAGGGLMLSGLGDFQSTAVLCVLVGLILLAFGVRTRWHYIHQNPALPQQKDEQ